jgi:hypothetical protein
VPWHALGTVKCLPMFDCPSVTRNTNLREKRRLAKEQNIQLVSNNNLNN